MGYDITFHPAKESDIQRYIFDVIEQPELGYDRTKELTKDPLKQRLIEQLYEQFPGWVADLKAGKKLRLESSFSYAAACISGFIHPYWYARNAAITMLNSDSLRELLISINEFANSPSVLRQARPETQLTENYTGSGFIADIEKLEQSLISLGTTQHKGKYPLFEVFDESTLASLREAIAYCKQHNCGLVEASDAVVPITDECFTDPDNMRQAEEFDEPVTAERQWYQAPETKAASAIDRFLQSKEICINDIVRVKRFFLKGRTATVVPVYMDPKPKYPNMGDRGYIGVQYDDGTITSVRERRASLVVRADSHSLYWQRDYNFEKEHFDKDVQESIRLRIQQAKWFWGDIPERELEIGLQMAYAGQWDLARAYYEKALEGAEILLSGSLLKESEYGYPGNLAEVLRTKALANALLNDNWMPEVLVEACEHHFDYAKGLKPADWFDIPQKNYTDFVLTALISGSQEMIDKMLNFKRSFGTQQELLDLYREVANLAGKSPSQQLIKQCEGLMDVIRHPNGSRFIKYGPLVRLLFAQMINLYLTPEKDRRGVRGMIQRISR